jgi:adenylate cyclase
MGARLKTSDGETAFPLEDFNLIGRSQDATIRLLDAGISRQHATIRREGKHFWVTDLGSANGSYVNDVAVNVARALRSGDRVQFGTSVYHFAQDESEGTTTSPSSGMKTQVLRSPALPMKTTQAILLVGDLRDFTRLSSQLSAEEVATMLREWYADCENVLKPRGATIDKFMGDGVLAYWSSVEPRNFARAAEAAQLLSRPEASQSPTRRWVTENLGVTVQCNVGLHVGEVALGSMGRGVNTIVGEAVNVTFRVEGLTRKLETAALATSAFVEGWGAEGAAMFESLGIHPVKGQPDPVSVHRFKESAIAPASS